MWLPTTGPAAGFAADYLRLHRAFYDRTLTAEQLGDWRDRQLRRVLDQVGTGSPFYARHLAGIDLSTITPATLDRLPFTTKAHLREEMLDVLSRPLAEAVFFYETTGTTGPATPCPRDGREVVASNAHVTESWASIFRHHFGDHAPRVGLMGPTEVHSFGDTLGDVARNTGAMNAKIWPYSPVIGFAKALQLMRDLELEVICCTPGVALMLAKAAEHHGYRLREDFAVELLFVTGEMCTPALAHNLESVWGADVYNILYGSQEAFVIATACRNKRMHLSQTNYLIEVVDPETGASHGPRGTGELTVTMLVDGVKPLIRYRTGDAVVVGASDCDCEMPGDLVQIVGRTLDRIDLGGQRRTAGQIESAVLTGVTGSAGYQVVIDHDPTGGDRLTVRLELLKDLVDDPAAVADGVRRRAAAALGVPVEVELSDGLDPIVSTGAFVSWKAARIVDRRVADDHETRVARRMAGRRGYDT
ncbi:phenylacetate--CoA ligase family protein [Micromonospora aurantiaca]|uniref:Phenylacetate--CoA ligase family protein n=1 Tax=Micromonospora aurantiaca (nom. illeg.) TaxID=47850 RepID=A0ABQ6ULM9_9ACTN|nr:phenylacetate--CoA ligase family protein [Micromonospora aurantiaca]KAB1118043.1 phenylacetate--CoA ligase family protein [Micromonospora aurantiaca]UFN96987.1 phenylacetate--CoA ligase family protein [Micromonospora aurantiaca]